MVNQMMFDELERMIDRDHAWLNVLQDLWVYEGHQGIPMDVNGVLSQVWFPHDVESICPPKRLRYLHDRGIVEKCAGGRSPPYRLMDRETVETILNQYSETALQAVETPQQEAPEDLFEPIVGYDDIKYWATKIVKKRLAGLEVKNHLLWIGAPATGKSIWFYEISRLSGVYFAIGSTASKAGLTKVLFDNKPVILIVDEADKLGAADLSALLHLAETGEVLETKVRGNQAGKVLQLDCLICAAANDESKLSPEFLSRFMGGGFTLKEYTREEFIEVVVNILVKREEVPEDVARGIGERVYDLGLDVREAVRAAQICDDADELDLYFDTLKRYR